MEKTKKRKGKCTGQKRIKSNKQFGIPGRKQWADPHRLKAAWYKIVCKMRRWECDTASIRYSQGGLLSFYNKVYKYTYLFLGWLCPWFFSLFRGSDHSCSLAALFNINIKYPFTTFALPIMHLVCPPSKFCISLGFNLSSNDCNTQEKLGKNCYTNQSANKVYYGQYKSCE